MVKLNKFIDKILIVTLSTIVSILLDMPIILSVVGVLISVIELSVSQCFSKEKSIYIIYSIFVFLCLIFPALFLFLPIGVYDIWYRKNLYVRLVAILLMLLCFISNNTYVCIIAIMLSTIAVFLALRTSQNEYFTTKLITLRDTSEENQLLLLERNQYLSKSKDDEINLAVMTERNRIAREIHDNVGHMLSRTILQMGAVRIINKDDNIKPHLEEINNSLNGAMTSMRESVHNLHDNSISLSKTLKEIVKPLNEKFTLKFDIDATENTAQNIKLCIIGIVKEAVSNIIKHSNGDNVSIIVCEHPAFYQIIVEDNGVNNSKINEGGIGIENMKIRTKNLNGIFKVTSNTKGFRVFVSIPKRKDFKK